MIEARSRPLATIAIGVSVVAGLVGLWTGLGMLAYAMVYYGGSFRSDESAVASSIVMVLLDVLTLGLTGLWTRRRLGRGNRWTWLMMGCCRIPVLGWHGPLVWVTLTNGFAGL